MAGHEGDGDGDLGEICTVRRCEMVTSAVAVAVVCRAKLLPTGALDLATWPTMIPRVRREEGVALLLLWLPPCRRSSAAMGAVLILQNAVQIALVSQFPSA